MLSKDLELTETSAKCSVREMAHHTLSRVLDLPWCNAKKSKLKLLHLLMRL